MNIEYELKNNNKYKNTIYKSSIIKKIQGYNNLQDQKYLTEHYLQLTDRPINKILNNDNNLNNISENCSFNNINSNSIGENFFQKDLKFNNNINKNSLSHIINSNSKSNILSRTDRKINNSNTNIGNNINNNNSNNDRQTSDLNNYSSKFLNYGINNQNIIINKNINIAGLNNKENQNKGLKPKIPTLKFPLDKTQPHQKFSLIRSSHRNDYSKSGDGKSTKTT